MKKGDGFLLLRGAVSLAAAFVGMLWAAAQYVGAGRAASEAPPAEETEYKDYAVVCAGPSNVWLAGESGAAAGVTAVGSDGACVLALHGDGSLTCVGVADSASSQVFERRFASLDAARAAGLRPDFGRGLVPDARREAGRGKAVETAEGGGHRVTRWSDGSVTCEGDVQGVPARVRDAVSVGASGLNVWAVSADGGVDAWGGSFFPGGLRFTARGPAACEIVDARVADSGLCLLRARAPAGLLEDDADGDGVPGVEEAFLHGTDPLAKDAGACAPVPAAAGTAFAVEEGAAVRKSTAARAAGSLLRKSLGSGPACYYADASRPDDSGDGLSWGTAKRTIQAAVDIASAGDTVFVTNGVYGEGTRTTPNGLFQNRLVITNGALVKSVNGAAATVIRGSGSEYFDTASAVR